MAFSLRTQDRVLLSMVLLFAVLIHQVSALTISYCSTLNTGSGSASEYFRIMVELLVTQDVIIKPNIS